MTRSTFLAALFAPFTGWYPRTTTLSAATPTEDNTTIRVAPRKAKEDLEILSSWIDPSTGDMVALVLLKKNSQKEQTSSTLLT